MRTKLYPIHGLFLSFLAALSSTFVFAADVVPQYEITASTQSSYFTPSRSDGNKWLSLSGGANYNFNRTWQLGGSFGLISSASFLTQLRIGPTVNFAGTTLTDSYYCRVQIGVSYRRFPEDLLPAKTSIDMNYFFAFGKRFPLASNITWNPEINFSGETVTGERPSIGLIPIQASLFF